MAKRQIIWEKNTSKHYLILTIIIVLGAVLRFSYLDYKPLGIDEVITAIFSLGKNFQAISVKQLFDFRELPAIFQLNGAASCADITININRESTHPPVFFCLLHKWLLLSQNLPQSLSWKLRALPAFCGVVSIYLSYLLGRLAFNSLVGLLSALIISFSPFAIYLSQEARHYTFPLCLILVSLIFLVKIQQKLVSKQDKLIFYLLLGLINSLAIYTHYFCLLVYLAEIGALCVIFYRSHVLPTKTKLASLFLPLILLLPWLKIIIGHLTSSKTSWLNGPTDIFSPLLLTIANWLMTIVALPVENQPLLISICSGLIIVIVASSLLWQAYCGLRSLIYKAEYQNTLYLLISFIIIIFLEFLGIIFILNKDISQVPRYNFLIYPAWCVLLAVSLLESVKISDKFTVNYYSKNYFVKLINYSKLPIIIITIASFFSSCLVITNLVFRKPYLPEYAAERFNLSPQPLLLIIGYKDANQIALGLSYSLALDKLRNSDSQTYLSILNRQAGYNAIWQNIANLKVKVDYLWVVAPGLKKGDYPDILSTKRQGKCLKDKKNYYRLGMPHQAYHCI